MLCALECISLISESAFGRGSFTESKIQYQDFKFSPLPLYPGSKVFLRASVLGGKGEPHQWLGR